MSYLSSVRRSVSMKHRGESWKYDVLWSIFDDRTSSWFIWWWITVSNAWYYFSNKMILDGEIKDAKMASFSSDFQTLIIHKILLYFFLWIVNEFEKYRGTPLCGHSRCKSDTAFYGPLMAVSVITGFDFYGSKFNPRSMESPFLTFRVPVTISRLLKFKLFDCVWFSPDGNESQALNLRKFPGLVGVGAHY